MVRFCSAINCKVKDIAVNKAKGISFHVFPKDPMRRKAWALATRREGAKKGWPWIPPKHACLCSNHFLEKDYEVQQATRRLREDVVPSVFEFERPAIKSKDKDPIIISTRSCKNAAELPTSNLLHGITQTNKNTTEPQTSNVLIPMTIVPTENDKHTIDRSTTNISGPIILYARNSEKTTEPSASDLSAQPYAAQEDEVQFLKNKLKTTKVMYEEGVKKLGMAQNEILEQNEMICELLNDWVSLKKKDENKLLKRKLEKTEAKYEEVCKNLRTAQMEISEQNQMIHELLNVNGSESIKYD
ncbi:hypothetical protein JTE90_012300 [Oedothorax gibbosus]|uniref:THAP-type domain-containing protein n=1 Tax=Oedothorax gibbosus TaxID=931172 RepID=A0AAV6VK16_9ARAC|nr:hypothetical protein JTE90_012300 [Oedothorax gibbosus]